MRSLVTDWTTERGDLEAQRRPRARAFTGTTLLMSTEELLAVVEEWPGAATPAQSPAAEAAIEQAGPPEPTRPQRVVRLTPPPPPTPRPGLLRRLWCGRRGHDFRPHRPLPHDQVVYRCLRCGMPTPAPEHPPHP